jgi:hypothetical protein
MALLVMLWAGLTHYGDSVGIPNVLQAILILSATGSYLITLVYLLLAGGALRLLWSDRDQGGLWWRLPVVLAGVAVPILLFDGSLSPFPDHPDDIGFYLGCAALGLSAVWYAALRVLRPDVLRADRPARIRAGDDC